MATTESGKLGGLLSAPLDFSAQKDYLTQLTSGALDKKWSRDQATLDQQLANKGIAMGSDAYTRAQGDFRNDQSAAYNSANVSNYNTALQSQLALRQAPINEILALAGQGGVQQPALNATPQTGVAGTDIAGISQSNFANQTAAYNQNQQQLGGLFGAIGNVGAAALPFILSDERTKSDIVYDGGETPDGIPTATWRYKWEAPGTIHDGVIAQDVQKIRPDAIGHIGGLLAVNSDKIPEAA